MRALNDAFAKIENTLTTISTTQDLINTQVASLFDLQRNTAIASSYTVPGLVVTAADAGTSITVTVAAHSRRYGDGTAAGLTVGTVTGLAYSTLYTVYYDDPTRSISNPTYVATINLKAGQNNYLSGRHLVGTVQTPAAAGAAVLGGIVPSGSGYRATGTGTGYTL